MVKFTISESARTQILNIYKGKDPMNSINDIWTGIMDILATQLTSTSINTWFADCSPIELSDGKFVIHYYDPETGEKAIVNAEIPIKITVKE